MFCCVQGCVDALVDVSSAWLQCGGVANLWSPQSLVEEEELCDCNMGC